MSNEDDFSTEDFEKLIESLDDGSVDEDEFERPLDVVKAYWRSFNPGEIYIRGLLIVESIKGDKKAISLDHSSGQAPWDLMGLLDYCRENMVWSSIDEDDDDD